MLLDLRPSRKEQYKSSMMRQRNETKRQPCIFYLQGRCDRGNRCRFSHQGHYRASILRHAQSEFNRQADKYPGREFLEEPAVTEFQLNEEFIDCPLSQEGIYQCKQTAAHKNFLPPVLDIVFVSPLNRALETAALVLKKHKAVPRRVIVLPELTEVLSKICDFVEDMKLKRQKYAEFDFKEMDRFVKQHKLAGEEQWQDVLVDPQKRSHINKDYAYGRRYLHLLRDVFPTPLQSSQRCFQRAMHSLEIMKQTAQSMAAQSILIVSHNRILKYFCGRFHKGRAASLQNCQIRQLMF